MARISTDAEINSIRVKEVAAPSTPASGYGQIYAKTDGKLYFKNDAGTEVELTFLGGALTNSNISPTTANVSAAVNNRYFADVSGLTADRNFVLPAGTAGDVIELNIKVGDTAFELVIIGDTGISINGGSTATLWSSVFIAGETVTLVADTTSNWQVTRDGRIPCKGLMTLSAAETVNSAATATTPTWDNKVIDVGEICDTTNYRMNIRRAGRYRVAGCGYPNAAPSDQNYFQIDVIKDLGGTPVTVNTAAFYASGATSAAANLSPKEVVLVVGDHLTYQYTPQQANKGLHANANLSWYQVEEVLP